MLPSIHLRAQDTLTGKRPDTLAPVIADTSRNDTTAVKPIKPRLEARVEYVSKDSIRFEVKDKKVILYKEADLKYQDIELKADYVEIDFPSNSVYATGMPDSTGKEAGTPEFTQGDQKFRSKVINYNYTTKKGYIQKVMTQQDEGYLQGQVVKKEADDVTYIKKGWYSTCNNEEHPHFEFRFDKAKVIPGKSIITGPAYMTIADVPTPLFIPFGYFPNKKGQRSGIILPSYGESNNRGFFLENGGYYWAISKYMDLKLVGDIFSRGSWAVKPVFTYKVRYHFSGSLNFSYALNRLGIEGTPGFSRENDYRIAWTHTQDKKARPKSSFSASVNIQSGNYNKYDISSTPDQYLTNTFQSSINYATNFGGKAFLNLNFNHNQNTIEHTMTINFPQVSLSVNQIYPFRSTKRAGKAKWYDKIGIRYNLDAQNRYNTTDSTLFATGWTKELQNGIKHTLPIGGTWNILKYINFSNALNINDRMYFSTIRKAYVDETVVNGDTIAGHYKTDTVYSFSNAFDFSLSTGINTRLYGMYQFKKGPVLAIRHMLTPSVSFSYTPNFGSPFWGYYREIGNDTATVNPQKYSIFQGTIYGGPQGQESGVVSFSLANNLEMKVRNRKDTVNGFKKIVLIDNFTISTSYDIAKDSLNWSPIALQGRTTIVKGLNIQYASLWDIYARDTTGKRINQTEWDKSHRILRLDNTTWDVSLNYGLGSEKFKKKEAEVAKMAAQPNLSQEEMDVLDYYDNYVDFDIPWSFNLSYSFRYTKNYDAGKQARVEKIVQTLGFNGQLNITPKWKITLYTGWDFTNSQLAYTRIDVYRDLHCWEMRFGWVPKGGQQMWNFSINVKASVLQDLKLNKKKNFYDY
jgi:lipopolysaccharide assembly outer membrane protein LptD (OstA)